MGALAASWRLEFRLPLTSDLAAPICLAYKADLSKRKRVKQKEVKEGHEKAIGRQLLKALKLNGKFLRHGEDDGEPDLIYSLDGKTVGIEIATAFYHNKQAEIESQLALGKLKSGRFGTPLGVPNDQDKVILSRAQWEPNDKCSKILECRQTDWIPPTSKASDRAPGSSSARTWSKSSLSAATSPERAASCGRQFPFPNSMKFNYRIHPTKIPLPTEYTNQNAR